MVHVTLPLLKWWEPLFPLRCHLRKHELSLLGILRSFEGFFLSSLDILKELPISTQSSSKVVDRLVFSGMNHVTFEVTNELFKCRRN